MSTLTRQRLGTLGAVILVQGPEAGHSWRKLLTRLSVKDENVPDPVLLREPRIGLQVCGERLGGHNHHPGLGVLQLRPGMMTL